VQSLTDRYTDEPVNEPVSRTDNSVVVGTWMWTAETGCYVLDRGAAEILTGNPDLAGANLPLDALAQRIRPADRHRFRAVIEAAEGVGGPVIAEYRVHTPSGIVRLLNHGRIYREAPHRPAHGHGVLINVTPQEPWRSGGEGDPEAAAPLERAAKHALASRKAIDEDGSESLRLLIDMVLLEIGRVIARRVGEDRARGLN
jgi:hypothetical protein